MSTSGRVIHVFGFGWIDVRPSEPNYRIHKPDPEPRYCDPDQERAEVSERLRLRRIADNPPRQPWPQPEIPMRVLAPGALPQSPARLLGKLQAAGWAVVVTYCRGTSPDRQRRPGRVLDSYALRSSLRNRRAVAFWTGPPSGKLTSDGVLLWGDRTMKWVGVKEFEGGL